MFRSKKGSQTSADPAAVINVDVGQPDHARPRPQDRRSMPAVAPSRPPGTTQTYPVEMPRPTTEALRQNYRSEPAASGSKEKTIVVGRGIELRGELSACERLVVEGFVDMEVKECRAIDVGESGTYRGAVEVDVAEISGDFEGTLTARERLVIRSTGRVRGQIRYRKIIIEAGGLISGDIGELTADQAETSTKPLAANTGTERTATQASGDLPLKAPA